MKKRNKNLPSNRETWQAVVRACKIWSKYSPHYLLSIFLYAVSSAVTPYISIYFSAQILNELAGERAPERLRFLVLLTVGATTGAALLTAVLKRWKQVCGSAIWLRNLRVTADKLFSMDFASADAAKTHDLLSNIKQNTNYMWGGLLRVTLKIEPIIQAVAGIFSGLALTVTLFTQNVPDTAGHWVILNNPVFIAAILLLLLTISTL